MSYTPVDPANCPTPVYHETHRYCPSCTWTEAVTVDRNQPATVVEVGCPDCGHDGPHPIVDQDPAGVDVECVGCYIEFHCDLPETEPSS